jgi:hypothetical protein
MQDTTYFNTSKSNSSASSMKKKTRTSGITVNLTKVYMIESQSNREKEMKYNIRHENVQY